MLALLRCLADSVYQLQSLIARATTVIVGVATSSRCAVQQLQLVTVYCVLCLRAGTTVIGSAVQVLALLQAMHARGVQPSAISYCCALACCEATGNLTTAFALYEEACESGIRPTDKVHNQLIRVCASSGHVDRALSEVKALMRRHGDMQQHTLNSLTRALSDQHIGAPACEWLPAVSKVKQHRVCHILPVAEHRPDPRQQCLLQCCTVGDQSFAAFAGRALRMLSFMRNRNMRPGPRTWHALVAGSARAAKSDAALQLYTEMRSLGHLPSSKAGSALLIALSQAQQLHAAILVARDMHNCAGGVTQPCGALEALARQAQQASETRARDFATVIAPTVEAAAPTAAHLLELTRPLQSLQLCDAVLATRADREELPAAWSSLAALDSPRLASHESALGEAGALDTKAPRGPQRRLQKRDMLPSAQALCELVLALALGSHCAAAMRLYGALRAHGSGALLPFALRRTQIFEQLIELNCRVGKIHGALQVFDDWKAVRDLLLQQPGLWRSASSDMAGSSSADSSADDGDAGLCPTKLSNVSLAFLEACCSSAAEASNPELKWRVYDVCAVMRQQQEARRERNRPRPAKGSHHVRAWYGLDESDDLSDDVGSVFDVDEL
jgi:pentatricopeptide repeat protein